MCKIYEACVYLKLFVWFIFSVFLSNVKKKYSKDESCKISLRIWKKNMPNNSLNC